MMVLWLARRRRGISLGGVGGPVAAVSWWTGWEGREKKIEDGEREQRGRIRRTWDAESAAGDMRDEGGVCTGCEDGGGSGSQDGQRRGSMGDGGEGGEEEEMVDDDGGLDQARRLSCHPCHRLSWAHTHRRNSGNKKWRARRRRCAAVHAHFIERLVWDDGSD